MDLGSRAEGSGFRAQMEARSGSPGASGGRTLRWSPGPRFGGSGFRGSDRGLHRLNEGFTAMLLQNRRCGGCVDTCLDTAEAAFGLRFRGQGAKLGRTRAKAPPGRGGPLRERCCLDVPKTSPRPTRKGLHDSFALAALLGSPVAIL